MRYTVQYNDDFGTTTWKRCYTLTGGGALMPCWMPGLNLTGLFLRARQP